MSLVGSTRVCIINKTKIAILVSPHHFIPKQEENFHLWNFAKNTVDSNFTIKYKLFRASSRCHYHYTDISKSGIRQMEIGLISDGGLDCLPPAAARTLLKR